MYDSKLFESYDRTIKFFTKFGFCRVKPPAKLPEMPHGVSEVGAVALPDGRVVICGGQSLTLMPGGRYETSNETRCWVWIHGSTEILPLEFYSKLPFNWLGPFSSRLMQLIKASIQC